MSKYFNVSTKQKENPAKRPIHPVLARDWLHFADCYSFHFIRRRGLYYSNRAVFSWVIIPREMVVSNLHDSVITGKTILYGNFCSYFIPGDDINYLCFQSIIWSWPAYGPYDIPLDKIHANNYQEID